MVRATCVLASCALLALLLVASTSAYPSIGNYYREDGPYEPEEIMDMLNRLGNLLQIERKMENLTDCDLNLTNVIHDAHFKDDITSEKRALDLGLSRGYSGALQAKHMLGVAAANSAFGPGRRRRDAQ